MTYRTFTFIGFAYFLDFHGDIATWKIALPNSVPLSGYSSGVYQLTARKCDDEDVWQKLQKMISGQRIRVTVETVDDLDPNIFISMFVTSLEFLDEPQEVQACPPRPAPPAARHHTIASKPMAKTTWRALIGAELQNQGETWEDIESITLSEKDLNCEFDDDYGEPKGKPFTAWTKRRVYFPGTYDGNEWVESVSRIPDGKPTEHVGCY